jgi:uncharacterized membrane protein
MDFVKLYFTALASLAVLDFIWLSFVAKGFYQKYLGYLMAPQVNFLPAIIFYLLYAAAIIWFVVSPNLKSGSVGSVFLQGAFLGLIAYAAYDLTNHATIRNWPWQMTVVDMAWGALLTALVSTIVFLIFKR